MGKVRRAWERYLGYWEQLTGPKKILFCLLHYTIIFLLAFLLAYSPFFQAGKSFIWVDDGRSQHYPTLVYVGRYLRQIVLSLIHGEIAIPLFDLSLAMGGDIISTLNYYGFGNPLYLLAAFVPTHYTEYLYNALIVVRLYLAGLAFWKFCSHRRKAFSYTMVGALVYVFSGYAVFSAVRHPYFVEPMIQLPLLLVGIDLLVTKKKPKIFILTVFYSALCGFYFLYMMTIMLGIYILARFPGWYKENRIREFFHMCGRTIGAYLLGIGLAAPLFFPAVIGFLTSGRAGESVTKNLFSYGWSYYKASFLNLIAPPGSCDALSLAAIVMLSLVTLIFSCKGRNFSLKIMIVVAGIFYALPLGGYIMNGFGYPSQRWTFGFVLLLSYIVVETLPELLTLDRRHQVIYFGVFLFYTFVVFCTENGRTSYHVVGVAMLSCTLLVLYLFGESNAVRKQVGGMACLVLVLFNISINSIYKFSPGHANYIKEFTTYGTETRRIETVIEREAEPYLTLQNGRFDSSAFNPNIGLVWHVPTSRGYWSVFEAATTDFMKEIENSQIIELHKVHGINKRTGIEALFSTKFLIESGGKTQLIPYGYTLTKETKKGNLIFENQYALPWGYTYENYILDDEAEIMNGLEKEEAMLQNVILEEDILDGVQSAVTSNILTVPYEIDNAENVEWEDKILHVTKDGGKIVLKFYMPREVEGYVRLQALDINNSGQEYFNMTIESDNITQSIRAMSSQYSWYWGRKDYLVNLGYSDEERTACTITFPKKGNYKLDDIQLFALPMDKYPEQIEALRKEPLENIKFGTNRITGTVDLSKSKILCMSIPYNRGWTAKVDGKKVKILKGNYMFMALPLTEGHHDIEFTYCTPGLRTGIGCSVVSLAVVVLLFIKHKRRLDKEVKRDGKY